MSAEANLAVNHGMSPFFTSPLVLGVLAAVMFAFIAQLTGRNRGFWAFGGGMMGVVVGSFLVGLVHAATIPYTAGQMSRACFGAFMVSGLIVICTGAVLFFFAKRPDAGR